MITVQVKNLNSFLAWLGTCEHKYTISSMQGGFVHIKFFIEEVPVEKLTGEEIKEFREKYHETR
jgi:hypothetical protein